MLDDRFYPKIRYRRSADFDRGDWVRVYPRYQSPDQGFSMAGVERCY
ncbi:uncharacterized protein METZ01_LOCUS278242 [marine metagenome]|uniref:Uncharacterized protein n=1 Tax=marine metagenome TaxID=408172 RepID=A0A382KLP5_9ZZZZ